MKRRPQQSATVHAFPLSPRMRLRQLTNRCSAWRVLTDRLPVADAPRDRLEAVLWDVLQHRLHDPRLTHDQAEQIVASAGSPGNLINQEMFHLRQRGLAYGLWSQVWERQSDPLLRGWAVYCVVMVARIYRLERRVRGQALLQRGINLTVQLSNAV